MKYLSLSPQLLVKKLTHSWCLKNTTEYSLVQNFCYLFVFNHLENLKIENELKFGYIERYFMIVFRYTA